VQSPSPSTLRLDQALLAVTVTTVLAGGLYVAVNQEVLEVTGRQRTMAFSVESEKEWADEMYLEMLEEAEVLPYEDPRNLVLQSIFLRLVERNEVARSAPWDWELVTIESDEVNAFATLGGKLVVMTGLLAAMEEMLEAGKIGSVSDAVAAVLGHEIGHAIARHSAENLSWLPLQIPFFAFSYKSPLMQSIFQYYIQLPFSRQNEYEADKIGITLMARAGFDPDEAMLLQAAIDQSSSFGEFGSTHPTGGHRATRLEKMLPEARVEFIRATMTSHHSAPHDEYMRLLVNPFREALAAMKLAH